MRPPAPSITYDDWKDRIQKSEDVDQLVRVVRTYLLAWRPEQLEQLPNDLAATALVEAGDIIFRAGIASRVELGFSGTPAQHALLREMALTFAAAATKLRFLRQGAAARGKTR
jgi:hypothetical protein